MITEDELSRPSVCMIDVTKETIGIEAVIKEINHFKNIRTLEMRKFIVLQMEFMNRHPNLDILGDLEKESSVSIQAINKSFKVMFL